MLLENKVVAITGTGSGVGRAAAILFASHGAKVVGGELREDWNEGTVEATKGSAGAFVPVRCDVTKEKDVAGLIDQARSEFGRIDVMFNNAGIASSTPTLRLDETTNDEYDLLMNVNLRSVFWGSKLAVIAFKEQGGGGNIVNTASASGLVGWGRVVYGVTKAGVTGFTRTLAIEVAPHRIRVNSVCPGTINTNYGRDLDRAFSAREGDELTRFQASGDKHPLRGAVEPEEVANAALFLVSDLAPHITGVNLPVDGGYTAG